MPTIIACLGLNHQTAPVTLREQFSYTLADLKPSFSHTTTIDEIVWLSTCNRIELYAAVRGENYHDDLLNLLLYQQPQMADALRQHSYLHVGDTAVDHLLHVVTGLDSLVLGEPQILGQVSEAYATAVAAHTVGPYLNTLFKGAIRAGKRARSETPIGSNPSSLSSVAITLARQTLGDLPDGRFLVVGAGEMGQLAVNALRNRSLPHVAIANRTFSRAQALAEQCNGIAYHFDQLPQAIAQADVVITAVSSTNPIIDASSIAPRTRPLVIVDIAVPRNVAMPVAQLPHVHLYDVDDLRNTLDESLSVRQTAVPQVEQIIAEETAYLQTQLQELAVRPVIVQMRRQAEKIREAELERTLRHLADLDPQTVAHIQQFSRALVNRLLHEPTRILKEKAADSQAGAYTTAVRDLFGLDSR